MTRKLKKRKKMVLTKAEGEKKKEVRFKERTVVHPPQEVTK